MHQETYFFHRHLLKERTALNKCSQQVGKLERSFYVKMHVSGENRLQRYEKIEFLGEGQFATVYKAKDTLNDNKIVAVKKIKLGSREEARDGINRTALREIKLLQELKHDHIIGLLDVFGHRSNVSLVFDFMDTDLEQIIKDTSIILTPGTVKAYVLMTLQGLEYLHLLWVLHRDLKPNNLLVNRQGILKLGDFGLAKSFASPTRIYTHQVVTRWYRAPELLFGSRMYGTGVDVWAVGCIMAELLLRVPFLPGESDLDQLTRIFSTMGTPTEDNWPGLHSLPDFVQFKAFPVIPLRHIFTAAADDLLQLLSRFLALNPAERCTCSEALQMPYFSNKPAPTPGSALPLPASLSQAAIDKSGTKRKVTDNGEGGSLAKRLVF
ncbi:Cyclin-dependent kinase 7 [Daphnia magna]|uniref:Cyclin-dependent kinase 7 n=2 Tax=Daphnia magna TaxID=35525 RepID=A0A0P5ZUG2_9CRUS|nr:Cyclin-dependent kinase 7 [Daphnia magna]